MSQTHYYLLPDVRHGLAASIDQSASEARRAQISATVHATAQNTDTGELGESTPEGTVQLYGPGDILGFDPRIVVRADPKPDVGDFESNYFPAIEFADADFAWRFSPDFVPLPENKSSDRLPPKLNPWITLIVLAAESGRGDVQKEFEEGARTDRNLPRYITVNTAELPDLTHAWRWAHVQIAAEAGLLPEDLDDILRDEPELAICRLLCPRRLYPRTRYAAFVVPTFKLGVLAGLGLELDAGTKGLHLAWTRSDSDESLPYFENGYLRLPYYYRWEFGTGLRGDFEHLVRLLEPRKLVGLGIRDIGCEKPGFGTRGVTREGLDAPEEHCLGLEGALQSLDTRYTWWGRDPADEPASPRLPEPLQKDLATLINQPEAQRIVLQFTPEILETSAIVIASGPDGTSVQFTWRTSMPCRARIDYGTTDAYGQHVAKYQKHQSEHDHLLILTGLASSQVYHFKITLETDDGASAQSEDRTFTMPPTPSVVPPIYGRWHAARQSVGPQDQEAWIETLNLDPRHRTAAGFGAEVIRKQQEPLMASAWEQLGAIESANDLLRRAQLGRESSNWLHQRLGQLPAEEFLWVTAPVLSRVLVTDPETGENVTAAHYLREQSPIPAAALDPAFRHIIRPRGPIRKRQEPRPADRDLLGRLASGDLEAAGPPPKPAGTDFARIVRESMPPTIDLSAWQDPLQPFMVFLKWEATNCTSCIDPLGGDSCCESYGRLVGVEPGENTFCMSCTAPMEVEKCISIQVDQHGHMESRTPQVPEPPVHPPGFIDEIKDMVFPALNPELTLKERVRKRLSLYGDLAGRFDEDAPGDPLDEIMAAPEFPQPMYEPLRDISHELLLPGVEKIPQNTLAVLKTNRRFLESYMCGLNHEFAAELLWRGYPTDQRGSYFRQFWDVSEYVPEQETLDALLMQWLADHGKTSVAQLLEEEWEWLIRRYGQRIGDISNLTTQQISARLIAAIKQECLEETLKDITALVAWGQNPLGDNEKRPQEDLVLVIRGDLLQRYPSALVYAIDAEEVEGELVPGLPEYLGSSDEPKRRIFPTFRAALPPDLTFFGFPFDEGAARGDDGDGPGKFFVIEERVGEARFGLDAPLGPFFEHDVKSWDNLSWSHFYLGADDSIGTYLDDAPYSAPVFDFKQDGKSWRADPSSATRAWITLQKPVRIALHASQMIPPLPPPSIDRIAPCAGLRGTQVAATIFGQNVDGVTGVEFSGDGVTTRVLPGGTENQLPLDITITPGAPVGARGFAVTTYAGTGQSPPDVPFVVLLIADAVAQDDYTVKIVLNGPTADCPAFLTNLGPYALVSPQALGELGAGIARRPVGTGPFVFEEWELGGRIVLARNNTYWGHRPSVQRLIFHFVPREALIPMLRNGQIHMCDTQSEGLASMAADSGMNVRRVDSFYEDHGVFLISRPEITGNFIGPDGLHLEFVRGVGELGYGCLEEPSTFDPLLMQDTACLKIATQILDGLTGHRPGEPLLVPCLAEGWETNADGTEWIFYLRQNVEFHDGVPLTAEAVVAGFLRYLA